MEASTDGQNDLKIPPNMSSGTASGPINTTLAANMRYAMIGNIRETLHNITISQH